MDLVKSLARSKGIVTSKSLKKSLVSRKGLNPMAVVAIERVVGISKIKYHNDDRPQNGDVVEEFYI